MNIDFRAQQNIIVDKNYNCREILEMRKTLVSPNETDLNKRLLPQKRVLLPDILQERIVKNVTFISRRETVDPTMEPLQPVRMFVVYENIEVSDQHDSSQYSSMNDTITYNMRLKPSKNKGKSFPTEILLQKIIFKKNLFATN